MEKVSSPQDREVDVEVQAPQKKGFGILFENPYLFGVAMVSIPLIKILNTADGCDGSFHPSAVSSLVMIKESSPVS